MHCSQARLAQHLDDVTARVEPRLDATVDGVYLGGRDRRRTAGGTGRSLLRTADGLKRAKLLLDRANGVHRVVSATRGTTHTGHRFL